MGRHRTLSYAQARRIPEFRMLQDAIAAEGRVEGKRVVVPDDLFRRLGEQFSSVPRTGGTMFSDAANDERDRQAAVKDSAP